MRNLIFIILFAAFFESKAQQSRERVLFMDKVSIPSSDSKIDVNANGDTILVSDFKFTNVKLQSNNDFTKVYKGTPFYNNGWFPGTVILEGGKESKGTMAFNLLTNSLFFSLGPDRNAIEVKPSEFTINGKKFRKFRNAYVAAGDIYYEQLVNGEIEIFKQYYCKLAGTTNGEKNGYEQSQNGYEGEFEKENHYFTIYHNKMARIGNKFKVFGEYAQTAKLYATKENLKLNKEKDLIKIANYLNSLILKK
jgi:hypothetical protein